MSEVARVRLGVTMQINVPVLTDGDEVSLVGRNISAIIVAPNRKQYMLDFTLDGEHMNKVKAVFEGMIHEVTGLHRIMIVENLGKESQTLFDMDAVNLVARSSMASALDSSLPMPVVQLSGGSLFVGGKGGEDGVGISSIQFVGHVTGGNKYKILLTSGAEYFFLANDGQDGQDGHTPYIQDKYWYINGESTGIKADYSDEEAARQSAYQAAEANRNGAYEDAENDRDEDFVASEAQRQQEFTQAEAARNTSVQAAQAAAEDAAESAQEAVQKFNAIKDAIDDLDPSQSTSDAIVAEAAQRAAKDAELEASLGQLGPEIAKVNNTLKHSFDPASMPAGRIKPDGTIGSSTLFRHTAPIAVSKGDFVIMFSNSDENVTSGVSLTDSQGSYYTEVVRLKKYANFVSSENDVYFYLCEENGYIALCGANQNQSGKRLQAYIYSGASFIKGLFSKILDTSASVSDIGKLKKIEYNIVQNKYISIDGTEANLNGYNCSDFVRVVPCTNVTISHAFLQANASIAFYDENKAFVSVFDKSGIDNSSIADATVVLTLPDNCYFIRWSIARYMESDISINDIYPALIKWLTPSPEGKDSSTGKTKIKGRIDSKGVLKSSSAYAYITPIFLNAGDTISVATASGMKDISIIALTDANSSSYTCLVAGEDASWDTSTDKTYKYKAEEDCYVAVCGSDYSAHPTLNYKVTDDTQKGYVESVVDKKIAEYEKSVEAQFITKTQCQPIASLVDDDCDESHIGTIKQICDALGIKASFACIHTLLQNSSTLLATLQSYQLEGYNIINHPQVNGWGYSDAEYNAANAERILVQSLLYFKQQGFLDCEHFVAPGGYVNDNMIGIVSKWYKSGISSNNGQSIHLAGDGKYRIHRLFVPETGTTLSSYTPTINAAFAAGDWLIIGTHSYKILDDYNGVNTKQLLSDVLSYMITKGFAFSTYNKAFKEREVVFDSPSLFK